MSCGCGLTDGRERAGCRVEGSLMRRSRSRAASGGLALSPSRSIPSTGSYRRVNKPRRRSGIRRGFASDFHPASLTSAVFPPSPPRPVTIPPTTTHALAGSAEASLSSPLHSGKKHAATGASPRFPTSWEKPRRRDRTTRAAALSIPAASGHGKRAPRAGVRNNGGSSLPIRRDPNVRKMSPPTVSFLLYLHNPNPRTSPPTQQHPNPEALRRLPQLTHQLI